MTDIKLRPEIKTKWLAALRSREYKQGKTVLHNLTEDTYCCLGVLCDIARKEGLSTGITVVIEYLGGDIEVEAFDNSTGGLPANVVKWAFDNDSKDAGFSSLCNLNQPIISDKNVVPNTTLADLNDVARFNFEQIADVIEEQF